MEEIKGGVPQDGKRFGYARGEKVMKEIRGGLPEKDANNNVINLKQKIFILKGLDIFCFF